MPSSGQLRRFATPLFLLALASIPLTLVMQLSGQRYYMYMMFTGIVCAQIDLGIAWLLFGGGWYWLRLPLIVVMTLFICYVMSYTFPQSSHTWLGMVLVRIPCIGIPLLMLNLRGARLAHVSDAANRRRISFQFSLMNLFTLFTTTVLFVFAGRFAHFPRGELPRLILFSLTSLLSLAAIAAAWSQRHTVYKIAAVLLLVLAFALLPEWIGGLGMDVMTMMLGAMTICEMAEIIALRLLGYRVEWGTPT